MKAASSKEIKSALSEQSPTQLIDLCLRLARFKKENKELLTYLLFEEQDEDAYIQSAKKVIEEGFQTLNIQSVYIAKKNLRKIIRITNKFIKYSGIDTTEITLLIYVCRCIQESGLKLNNSVALKNIYLSLLKKISTKISDMHEDLQYDFNKEIQDLEVI
ncbi:MAG: hypothetical protein NT127_04135 [Sphingobacteriales bacterium]|nr:hypothetical protein [Sphingobacteriales bacterium]